MALMHPCIFSGPVRSATLRPQTLPTSPRHVHMLHAYPCELSTASAAAKKTIGLLAFHFRSYVAQGQQIRTSPKWRLLGWLFETSHAHTSTKRIFLQRETLRYCEINTGHTYQRLGRREWNESTVGQELWSRSCCTLVYPLAVCVTPASRSLVMTFGGRRGFEEPITKVRFNRDTPAVVDWRVGSVALPMVRERPIGADTRWGTLKAVSWGEKLIQHQTLNLKRVKTYVACV